MLRVRKTTATIKPCHSHGQLPPGIYGSNDGEPLFGRKFFFFLSFTNNFKYCNLFFNYYYYFYTYFDDDAALT
jgi:hypothetical protein